MATVALGAGMAFGQAMPTLQQGMRQPANGMGYNPAPASAFPMSFPQASAEGYPAPFPPAPHPMPTFPVQTVQPTQPKPPVASTPVPAETVVQEQPEIGFPVPGQPLMADP